MTVLGRPRDCTNQPKSNVWGLLLSHSIFESKIGQAGPPLFFSPYNPLNAFHVSVNFDLEIVVASEGDHTLRAGYFELATGHTRWIRKNISFAIHVQIVSAISFNSSSS